MRAGVGFIHRRELTLVTRSMAYYRGERTVGAELLVPPRSRWWADRARRFAERVYRQMVDGTWMQNKGVAPERSKGRGRRGSRFRRSPGRGGGGLGMVGLLVLSACSGADGAEGCEPMQNAPHLCADGSENPEAASRAEVRDREAAEGDGQGAASSEPAAEDSEVNDGDDTTPVPASSEGPAQNWPVPDPPDEIYDPTEEGAEAALRYWWELRVYARNTGDTEPLEEFSDEACEICDLQIDRVQEMYESGWFVQEEDVLTGAWVRPMEWDDFEDEAFAIFRLVEGGFDGYWEGSHLGKEPEGAEVAYAAHLQMSDHWTIHNFQIVDEYEEGRSELEDAQ